MLGGSKTTRVGRKMAGKHPKGLPIAACHEGGEKEEKVDEFWIALSFAD